MTLKLEYLSAPDSLEVVISVDVWNVEKMEALHEYDRTFLLGSPRRSHRAERQGRRV
jgi:hypothetical protein